MIQGARVLVADDEPEMLEAVSGAMECLGAIVSRASSGAELVTLLAEDKTFNLIITDIAMPWASGLKVMEIARRTGVITPVIIMTALPDAAIVEQVRALGDGVVFLRKPFDLDSLVAAATSLLSRPPKRASGAP